MLDYPLECLALPSIEGVVVLYNVKVIYQDEERCILWVSGEVSNISEVVTWVGGFICPTHDELAQYTSMNTSSAGSMDGDIIVVLSDDSSTADDYETAINEWLTKEGKDFE